MDNPTGIIQSLVADAQGTRAIVEVDVSVVCPRCAAGKGCGAGLLTGSSRIRQVEALVTADLALEKGDAVEIALASSNVLRAALIVYGMPLLGALAAAGLAYLLALGDAAAALAAIGGLVLGLIAGRWRLGRSGCIDDFVPQVEKRLHRSQVGA